MPSPCPPSIATKIDALIELCGTMVQIHPALVVVAMHDFYRNLYPTDPYISLYPGEHRLDAIESLLDKLLNFLTSARVLGSYPAPFSAEAGPDDVREETGTVYGKLWNAYPEGIVKEAVRIVEERFSKNDISMDLIKGKTVLDAGCGSGRYALALSKLGAKKVVAIDFGDDGIALGKRLASEAGILNVEFVKGDLRAMPFSDGEFDFIFSNGTAHHTGDIEACTKEIFRTLKVDGSAWYYIYGAGGVFWYARRKMNDFMKSIPQDYAMAVLKLMGMPMNRFIFGDNWYVPIELHTSAQDFEKSLGAAGFATVRRCYKGRVTDFDNLSVCGTDKDRAMWGDGELRYFVAR